MPRVAKPSPEEAAFLQAILDDPDSDIPRLVYADWLEERGHPRGTFIRLQCERDKLTHHDPAWKELLAQEAVLFRQHEAEWTAPLKRHVLRQEFRRGFVHEIMTSTLAFLKSAPILFRHAPLQRVVFSEFGPDLGALADCPFLARLSSIRFPGRRDLPGGISVDGFRRLVQSAFVANLNDLSLGPGCDIWALAGSPHLAGLRTLLLVDNNLGEEATTALAAANFQLHYLNLAGNQLNSRAIAGLADGPVFSELRGLVLLENHITNLGVDALARSPFLKQLEHLDLSSNRINDSGIPALIELAASPALKYLRVEDNEFGRAALRRLAEAPECARIRELAPSRLRG